MKAIDTPAAAAEWFRSSPTPLFYACTAPGNLLGLRHWIPGLHFLSGADFFDRQLRRQACPAATAPEDWDTFERMNNRILRDDEVRHYIQERGPQGRALFLMFDEENEESARAAGLTMAFPSAALRRRVDDKIATTRLGNEAGVRSVPNVLARVDGYATLRRVAAALGPELVIQLPFGDSGRTTFFVSSEEDYAHHAGAIEAAPEVKIMRRIRCRQAAIEACVTRRGTAVGPLATELVGFPELTPYRGGWCGNEIAPGAFSASVLDEAAALTRRFGERLAALGYRGIFGLDFLIDEDAGDLFLGEMNPRITGLSPLSTQAARDLDCAPLMMLHLLEWLDVPHTIDVEETSARFRRLDGAGAWSQLIIKEIRDDIPPVSRAPQTGIWRMDESGFASFARASVDTGEIHGESEALVTRSLNEGFTRPRGTILARLLSPGRMMTPQYALQPRARAWMTSVRRHFPDSPHSSGLQQ